jgi:hypothetical protein
LPVKGFVDFGKRVVAKRFGSIDSLPIFAAAF